MIVEIFQVKKDIDEVHDIIFMDYQFVTKLVPDFINTFKNYYNKVYEYNENTNLKDEDFLEEVFKKFNINRPDNFKGHSLSVSDIIILDNDRIWYCDSFGFKEMK